ncbi:MAG TPA: hypothetical protein VF916_04795 [Ktedonobacterales bacterium]
MAAAKKQTPTTLPVVQTPEDIAALRAERDALNKQIREATRRAAPAKPALTLDEVIAKQTARPNFYACDTLAPLLAARVLAGASYGQAWEGLATLYGPLLITAAQQHADTPGQSWDDSIAAALGRERQPRKAAKEQNRSAS